MNRSFGGTPGRVLPGRNYMFPPSVDSGALTTVCRTSHTCYAVKVYRFICIVLRINCQNFWMCLGFQPLSYNLAPFTFSTCFKLATLPHVGTISLLLSLLFQEPSLLNILVFQSCIKTKQASIATSLTTWSRWPWLVDSLLWVVIKLIF